MASRKDEGNFAGPQTDNLIDGKIIGSLPTQDSIKDSVPNAKLLSNKELPASQVADSEALGLLRWLATSQAGDDINSDDELVCETILSPLLLATTIDNVLNKANVDYETESLKECQDILDSVGDMVDFERSQERASCPSDRKNSSKSSSEYVIPQVDGCGDDDFSTPFDGSVGSFSEIEGKSEFRTSSHQVQDASSSFNHQHKRKKLWGSLPFSETSKMKTEGEHASLHIETKDPNGTISSSENEVGKRAGTGTCDAKDSGMLARCSVRDLMRRKRSYRVEPPESSGREENEDTLLCAKHLDFQVSGADELDRKPQESSNFRLSLADQQSGSYKAYKYDSKPTNPGCSLYGKLPLCSSSNENILHASTLDGKLDSNVLIGEEVGAGAMAQFRNSLIRGPCQVPSVNKRYRLGLLNMKWLMEMVTLKMALKAYLPRLEYMKCLLRIPWVQMPQLSMLF